jgi:hypothetical protein
MLTSTCMPIYGSLRYIMSSQTHVSHRRNVTNVASPTSTMDIGRLFRDGKDSALLARSHVLTLTSGQRTVSRVISLESESSSIKGLLDLLDCTRTSPQEVLSRRHEPSSTWGDLRHARETIDRGRLSTTIGRRCAASEFELASSCGDPRWSRRIDPCCLGVSHRSMLVEALDHHAFKSGGGAMIECLLIDNGNDSTIDSCAFGAWAQRRMSGQEKCQACGSSQCHHLGHKNVRLNSEHNKLWLCSEKRLNANGELISLSMYWGGLLLTGIIVSPSRKQETGNTMKKSRSVAFGVGSVEDYI